MGGPPSEGPPRGRLVRWIDASCYLLLTSVGELHVEEYRVHIRKHWTADKPGLFCNRRVRGLFIESQRLGNRERELAVVVMQVLRIQREAQILIVLIGYTDHPSLEVKRILVHVNVRLQPVEHPEYRQRRSRNVVVAEEGESLLRGAPVVQQRIVQSSDIVPTGVMDGSARRARARGCRSGRRRSYACRDAKGVTRTGA